VTHRQVRCEAETVELRQVQTFRAVAEELSFSRAAVRLGYVQSSVSTQVAALEQELGVPLFDRLGRRVALTEAGTVMLAYSGKLLELAGATRQAVTEAGTGAREVTGSVRLSAPETLLTYRLPRVLAAFHDRYPKVRLSLRPSPVGRLVGTMRRAVEEGTVEVAFILDSPAEAPSLCVEPLLEEAVTVIAPPAHPLRDRPAAAARDLAGETVLLPEAPESGCAYRGQFERQLGAAGVVPTETMEFQSIEAVKQCVAAGMGVSVLPTVAVATELGGGTLAALPWAERFEVRTQMVWHRERWQSPALRAFLDTARQVFAVAPAAAG
jgi:DNA-binding transcriptional LysR family regulator